MKDSIVISDAASITGGKNSSVVLSTELTVSTKKEKRIKKERKDGYDYILYIKNQGCGFYLNLTQKMVLTY
jgi:protein associated with RNAse G/E